MYNVGTSRKAPGATERAHLMTTTTTLPTHTDGFPASARLVLENPAGLPSTVWFASDGSTLRVGAAHAFVLEVGDRAEYRQFVEDTSGTVEALARIGRDSK